MKAWRREQMPRRFHYGTHPTRLTNIIVIPETGWTLDYAAETRPVRKRGTHGFDNRDRALAVILVALITVCAASTALGQTQMLFSPIIVLPKASSAGVAVFAAFLALCLLPLALQVAGEVSYARRTKAVTTGGGRRPLKREIQEKGRTA